MSLSTNLNNLSTRLGTESKALRTLLNGNAADLSALATTNKSSLVAALNELSALINAVQGADINDGVTATTTVWSSQKTNDVIVTAINQILGGASAAFDTLLELQTALQGEQGQTTAILSALGKRLAVDQAQSFTAPEKAQGLANLGAIASADIGDPNTDFVAVFNAALV